MRILPVSCGLGYAFLIESPQALFLVDSGSPGQHCRVLEMMKRLGRADLKLIWITHAHYDHFGSAAALRGLTGALIGVHPADAQSLRAGSSPLGRPRRYGRLLPLAQRLVNLAWRLPATPPDFLLEDGETLEQFGLQARILHTPGHTPGHTCLLLPDGTALAGDLLGRRPRPRLQTLAASDWAQLSGSLRKLQAARPEWVYTGHSAQPLPGWTLQLINA
ncbi:MAG: MBL fold metallo-hydrolase [Anaerolineales bacterium]|jgi:glyoxylase-like metal-dependent hydrolase (beta-lactamase superfamily II)|nr:MBL fold metallo-hydrolase [Anaerolineales bacterium]